MSQLVRPRERPNHEPGALELHAPWLITFDPARPVVHDALLRIQGGAVASIAGPVAAADLPPAARRCPGVVTPGLINAHAHLYGAFARGLALGEEPPRDFLQVLQKLWWKLDRALDLEAVAASARIMALEALAQGVTTIIDHHASPQAVTGSLDAIAEVVAASGLRAALCYEVSDRDGPAVAAAGRAENARFLRRIAAGDDAGGRLRGRFGLHAAFTLADDTLRAVACELRELGSAAHVHLAESRFDRHGLSRLLAAGVLGPGAICAHGVHLAQGDLARLAATGATLVHNPTSNLNNAVGALDLAAAARAGLALALGTDGMTMDLLSEARAAMLVARHSRGDPAAAFEQSLALLTQGNPRLASAIFGRELGVLREGAAADLLAWDYRPATPLNAGSWGGHVPFGLAEARVKLTMIAGEICYLDGSYPRLDAEAWGRSANVAARRTWERFAALPPHSFGRVSDDPQPT